MSKSYLEVLRDTRVIAIARVCHEANLGWCAANGDDSQKTWSKAEAWQRESAVMGVAFAIANPDAPDSAQHDAWMVQKLADGWVYGEVKDAEAKTHPCLVPFEQLPAMQQAKDRLFRAIVKALSEVALQQALRAGLHTGSGVAP